MAQTMRAERFYADTKTVALETIRDGIAALERAEGNPIRILVQP